MQVLVVGGEPRFITGTFSSNLSKLGLHMSWHWPWKRGSVSSKTLKPLPEGVELVIVVSDMVRRALRKHAETAATHAGVPFVNVPRKFSIAHQKLEAAGYVQPHPKPKPKKDVNPMNAHPKLQDGVEVQTQEYEFISTAKEAIEDEPEATNEQILATLASLFESNMPVGAAELVAQAREEITAQWHKHYNKKTPEEHEAFVKVRNNWALRQMQRGFEADGIEGIPSQSKLRARMRDLFGSACNSDVLSGLRQQVLDVTNPAPDAPNVPDPDPEPLWYEEKGIYKREGVEAEVTAGLEFYEALHNSTVAKLSLWALENKSGKPKPPSATLRRYLTPLDGSQLRFAAVMRMAVPTIISAHVSRCYSGLTSSGFGSYALRAVDTELTSRGIFPKEELPPEPEEAGDEEADVGAAVADQPDELDIVEESEAVEPIAEVVEEPEPEPEPEHAEEPEPERPLTTRMHPDDRAMLVADLRAALATDRAELARAVEAATEESKAAREAAESQARDMAALVEGLDSLAVGLGKLSDAVVAIRQNTESRQTVSLDAESVALIRGLETRIIETVGESIRQIKVKLPEAPAPATNERDTLRRLIEDGRGFKLEVSSTSESE